MVEQNFTPEELASEEWREIPGFEGLYLASTLGRVMSISISPYRKRKGDGILKNLQAPSARYPQVALFKDRKGHWNTIHKIVALTFIGPRPPGHAIDHIDFDRRNNRLSNLRYITHKANIQHTMAAGRRPRTLGPYHWKAKMDRQMIHEIRRRNVIWRRELAEEFGVTQENIAAILTGRTWKHLVE